MIVFTVRIYSREPKEFRIGLMLMRTGSAVLNRSMTTTYHWKEIICFRYNAINKHAHHKQFTHCNKTISLVSARRCFPFISLLIFASCVCRTAFNCCCCILPRRLARHFACYIHFHFQFSHHFDLFFSFNNFLFTFFLCHARLAFFINHLIRMNLDSKWTSQKREETRTKLLINYWI